MQSMLLLSLRKDHKKNRIFHTKNALLVAKNAKASFYTRKKTLLVKRDTYAIF